MATRIFKSNPINRLNYENDQFKLRIDEIAFTSPTSYFRMKKEFLKALVEQTIVSVHSSIYNALTTGTDGRGLPIFDESNLPTELQGGGAIEPKVPDETADEIAMNVANTLKNIYQNEVVDRIFKTDNISMALERASRNAELKVV